MKVYQKNDAINPNKYYESGAPTNPFVHGMSKLKCHSQKAHMHTHITQGGLHSLVL